MRDESGEPVRVADRRHDDELELEVEVGDHPPEHVDLLRVLLAVEREVRADDVEQLEADRRDAAEVAGAVLAFQRRAELGHVDPRLVAGRVHLGRGRGEDDVDPCLACDLEVARLVARVAVQVGRLAELRRVDEEAHHDRVAAPRARRASSARWPAWSAPIVGTRPTVPSRRSASAARTSATVRATITRELLATPCHVR